MKSSKMITIILVALFFTVIYCIGWYNEYYWKKRGVVLHARNKVIGPVWDFLVKRKPMFQVLHEIYQKHPNEPAVGLGRLLTPSILIIDPENIQHVLQTDFQAFTDRELIIYEKDLLADNVLFMRGNRWKLMRQHLTPMFTSAKLKKMYYIIDKSAQDFVEYLKINPEKLKGGAFDTLSHFCCAAIGAAVFGIDTGSTFESPFLDMATKAFKGNWKTYIKFGMANLCNGFLNTFKIKLFDDYEDFFIGAIKQVLRRREKDNTKRHDFADLCLNIQKDGILKDNETGFELIPSDELLAAQGFFFFSAGVEPTATGMFGALYELGRNKEILDKIHLEIDSIFDKYHGNMTMDAINELEYLDKVLNEALRMYPPVGNLGRICTQDSVLPVGNIKIDRGTKIIVPLYELCHDPKYWTDPEVFDPQRFSNNKQNDLAYYPFGKGNRACIGTRYARLQSKAGIFHILRNFTLRTIIKKGGIKYRMEAILLRPINADIEFIPRNLKT